MTTSCCQSGAQQHDPHASRCHPAIWRQTLGRYNCTVRIKSSNYMHSPRPIQIGPSVLNRYISQFDCVATSRSAMYIDCAITALRKQPPKPQSTSESSVLFELCYAGLFFIGVWSVCSLTRTLRATKVLSFLDAPRSVNRATPYTFLLTLRETSRTGGLPYASS